MSLSLRLGSISRPCNSMLGKQATNYGSISRLTLARVPSRQMRRGLVHLRASLASENDTEAEQPQPSSEAANSSIKQTMSDLDAMLGIVEEEPEEEQKKLDDTQPQIKIDIGVSPEVLRALAEAEASRAQNSSAAGGTGDNKEVAKKVNDSISRIVEQARKLSSDKDEDSTAGEQAMRSEFENLLVALTGAKQMDPEDVKKIKDQVFGPNTFWVTSTMASPEVEGGLIVKGNMRGPQAKIFEEVSTKIQDLFGEKYIVRLVEDIDLDAMDMPAEPRVAFQILPKELAMPPPVAGWQQGASLVLILLTLGSAFQLGVAANINFLPKETLAWLANPANVNADVLPPGLENFDPVPFVENVIRVGGVALLPQLTHELGHSIAAAILGLKTGPSFLIPNSQLATFGSITQLKSLAKNKTQLFDFAASGLLGGAITSLVLFITGLVISHNGGGAEAGLIPVPTQLFQGSLLLGGISQVALGADSLAKTSVFVSPLLIGGWCGLVMTALNSLPVGNLDGGRTMLSAYGKNALAFSSLASYIGLGLGLLGSSLALPFGLYILICQRESERNLQDEVSEIDSVRQGLALAIIAFAILILIPGVSPDDAAFFSEPANFI